MTEDPIIKCKCKTKIPMKRIITSVTKPTFKGPGWFATGGY